MASVFVLEAPTAEPGGPTQACAVAYAVGQLLLIAEGDGEILGLERQPLDFASPPPLPGYVTLDGLLDFLADFKVSGLAPFNLAAPGLLPASIWSYIPTAQGLSQF